MATLKQIQQQAVKYILLDSFRIMTIRDKINLVKAYIKLAYEQGGKDVLTKLKSQDKK